MRPGTVYLVGAGPGDPGLLTARALELLRGADVVLHDRLIPSEALRETRADALVIDVGKIGGGEQVPQEATNALLLEHARAGRSVVRLKGGDPFVFGRGGEEALACAAAGVPVLVVPGVTSSIAAPALAGIPVTHRGVAHEFTVVSGHVAPDSPASLVDWPALARMRGTLVVLMGLKNLPAIAATLIQLGKPADIPAAVVQEGSTDSQRVLHSTLGRVAADSQAAGLRPPAVVVIGDVVNTLA
jgi:uroporphyrin-III C-methyltransferase / precorrin-2 dehydrogenase / sirohydrochlorin ferrochelatase